MSTTTKTTAKKNPKSAADKAVAAVLSSQPKVAPVAPVIPMPELETKVTAALDAAATKASKKQLAAAKKATEAKPELPTYTAETLPVPTEGATHFRYTNCRVILTQKVGDLNWLVGLKHGIVEFGTADSLGETFKTSAEVAAAVAKKVKSDRFALPDGFEDYVKLNADGTNSATFIAEAWVAQHPTCTLSTRILRRRVRRMVRLAKAADANTTLKLAAGKRVAKDGIKGKAVRKAARPLYDALSVIALTPTIVAWLDANDPKALEQVRAALALVTG